MTNLDETVPLEVEVNTDNVLESWRWPPQWLQDGPSQAVLQNLLVVLRTLLLA